MTLTQPPVGFDYSLYPIGATVTVAGLPVGYSQDVSAFYVAAVFENVTINGAPLVAYFDPPVSGVSEVSLPGLLQFLIDALDAGAIIHL